MRRPPRSSTLAGAAFGVVSAVHLAAQALSPERALASGTQMLLMPALAAVLLCPPRPMGPGARRLRRAVLAALGLSWLGDTLPRLADGGAAFLLMLGPFLLAQVAYVLAFAPLRGRGIGALAPRLRSLALLPYGTALVVMIALCAAGAGALLPAVAVYGLALVSMAVLATGLGPMGAAGGAIFLASDAMIGLEEFAGLSLPFHDVWVMATYVLGQALLVMAVRAEIRSDDSGVERFS